MQIKHTFVIALAMLSLAACIENRSYGHDQNYGYQRPQQPEVWLERDNRDRRPLPPQEPRNVEPPRPYPPHDARPNSNRPECYMRDRDHAGPPPPRCPPR